MLKRIGLFFKFNHFVLISFILQLTVCVECQSLKLVTATKSTFGVCSTVIMTKFKSVVDLSEFVEDFITREYFKS